MTTKAEEAAEKVTRKLEMGNRDVLEQLRRMVAAVNGAVDPDLEQEVFLRVLEAFRRLRHVHSPHALMRKIVRDTVVDSWRSRRRVPSSDIDQLPALCLSETPRFEERIDRARELERLRESILDLGCDIRGPVYLFYVENYPIRALARIFGKSPSAIKMALHRGRRQLERMICSAERMPKNKVAGNASSRPPDPSNP